MEKKTTIENNVRRNDEEQEDHRVYPIETRKEVLIIWSRRRSNFG